MASTKVAEHGISQMVSADRDADIRQPSINTEPRTLNEMKMERAMVIFEVAWILVFGVFFSCFRVSSSSGSLSQSRVLLFEFRGLFVDLEFFVSMEAGFSSADLC